jgi:hypothetical protein
MKTRVVILILLLPGYLSFAKDGVKALQFDFYGQHISLPADASLVIAHEGAPSAEKIQAFYNRANTANYQPLVAALLAFKEKNQLNDWIFYQLIRKTAQQFAPKTDNYARYTLYKWFLLGKSGYDARLSVTTNHELIFCVRSDENIYDIPYYTEDGRQYVCLNIHDYVNLDFGKDQSYPSGVLIPEGQKAFSYKVTQMPDMAAGSYEDKEIAFEYGKTTYHFNLKVNPDVQQMFKNYPVVDYESYFNIPMSSETYNSLVPMLQKNVARMEQQKGVDYLMKFTRNAFLYEDDQKSYGKEKRFSPEQTLLNPYSDCDDRAALFFYLVKEIYNLPMIVLLYPTHVTIAVKFETPVGTPIMYKGNAYTVCEPTPQWQDLRVGQLSPELRKQAYTVAYEYNPVK